MYETNRLTLTPMAIEDAPFVLELLNTKEYIDNIGQRNINTIEETEKYIYEKMIIHYEKNDFGNYLITRKEDGQKIGCVSLYNREDVEGVDIGFAMLPDYFGKGYAYEGAEKIKNVALTEKGLKSICAFTSRENKASQGLIEKLGLTFEKTILFGEEKEELLYYSADV